MTSQSNQSQTNLSGRKKTSGGNGAGSNKAKLELGAVPLTQSEVSRLINSTDNLEDRVLLLLGFYTGARTTEIVSLEPINFEFSNGIVKIWDRQKRLYRTVSIPDEIIDEIRLLIDMRKDSAGPKIFPFTAKTIESRFQLRTLKVLGESRSWESLRRTYISTSAKLGIPIWIVVNNTGEPPSKIVDYYMKYPVINARRRVNEILLFPESPRTMLKSDELKRILEGPYVEKIDQIMSEKLRIRNALNNFKGVEA